MNILENLNEGTAQDLDPYSSIFQFIEGDIIPKYPCLTSVFQDNFDEEGNPRIPYYIRYAADLSLVELPRPCRGRGFLDYFFSLIDFH